MTARTRRILLFSCIALGICLRLLFAVRPPELLTERPYQDDAYYVMQCAWHLAQGHGFTVDGVHPTNGLQPLIAVFYAPLFYIFHDKWTALRSTFLLVALFDLLSILGLRGLIRTIGRNVEEQYREASMWIIAAIWALSYAVMVHTSNGLETGLYSTITIFSLWRYIVLRARERNGIAVKGTSWLSFGALLGLLVLARIDSAILVAVITGWEVLRSRKSISNGVLRASLIGSGALLVSSPWWWYNVSTFGSLMPISGQSESIESLLYVNLYTLPQTIGDILSTLFYLPFNTLPAGSLYLWPVLIAGFIYWLSRGTNVHQKIASYDLAPLAPFALWAGVLVIYYTFFFSAPHFISRYLQPLRILWLLIASLGLPFLWQAFTQRSASFRTKRTVLTAYVTIALFFSGLMYLRGFTTSQRSPAYFTGVWAAKVAPAKVGMTSSGTANFVSSNIVNLDGKVNYQALLARHTNKLAEYIVDNQIDYVADWRPTAESLAKDAGKRGVVYQEVDSVGPIIIFKRQ